MNSNDEHYNDISLPPLFEDAYIGATYIYRETLSEEKHVYVANGRMDDKPYVIKQLSQFDEQVYRALRKEKPAGIPQIFEVNRLRIREEDCLVLIEEYVEGESLTCFLKTHRIDAQGAERIIRGLCMSLQSLHDLKPQVIHRDVKPDNIIIRSDGRVCLIDFNIARQFAGTKKRDTVIMGTEGFAAPEQFGFAESDVRTDVYGLGATLLYMIETCGIESKELRAFGSRCTAIDPDGRPQTVSEVLGLLDGAEGVASSSGSDKKAGEKAYALPGFRSDVLSNRILGLLAYGMIIYLSVQMKFDNTRLKCEHPGIASIAYKLVTFMILSTVLLFSCNYMGMQEKIGMIKNSKGLIRVLLVIIMDFLIIVSYLVIFTAFVRMI